tara:strand:- start:548 stop:769 length:222 start_codon:yes stop_codon:yes gene_type:complete
MKKKANKKELQDIVARLIGNVAILEQRVASYNTLFSMYVKYKDDSDGFQVYLKEELEKKDAEIGQVKDKEVSE